MKSLIITEKPSVAVSVSNVLKCSRNDGYFESNDYIVTFAVGHLDEWLLRSKRRCGLTIVVAQYIYEPNI